MSDSPKLVTEVLIECPECNDIIAIHILFDIIANKNGNKSHYRGVDDSRLRLHIYLHTR